MKTKFFAILILVLFCLPISVNAHSGRTDSNGGHTDHSTGEYHYHHGYPAHDHWDMDGDGDIDCPYTYTPPKESKPTQPTDTKDIWDILEERAAAEDNLLTLDELNERLGIGSKSNTDSSSKTDNPKQTESKDNRTIIFAATGAAAALGAGVVIGRKTKK